MEISRSMMKATDFTVALARHNVSLPVAPDPAHFGVVVDANGRDVLTVDVNGERPEIEVSQIMSLVIEAINRKGGLVDRRDA